MVMGVIGWIVLGLIAGYIASTLVNKRGEGLPFDILLGIVGAGDWRLDLPGGRSYRRESSLVEVAVEDVRSQW